MSSSWSRTQKSTPRLAAGDLPTSQMANLATRRCTRRASPATNPLRIATLSSPVTHLSSEKHPMLQVSYDKKITALLVIDPYDDFISEGGKVWDRLKAVADANGCVPNVLEVLNAARKAGVRVFYAPHRRYRPGD